MDFGDRHSADFLERIRAHFHSTDIGIGEVDMSYADCPDMPCVYVEFFVNGIRYLADVYTDDSGIVDWVY